MNVYSYTINLQYCRNVITYFFTQWLVATNQIFHLYGGLNL